jgi:hypothetical protein
MKTYQSTTEGIWVELRGVKLTKEQRDLMRSKNEDDAEAQSELSQWIKSQREVEVDEAKAESLTVFYNTIKPELKEDDTYHLISIDLSEKSEGVYTGILNCRVNGEHEQIRF